MTTPHEIPPVNGVDLSGIRNRNEKRVATLMPGLLEEEAPGHQFDPLDLQDIFALTLNLLPPRYSQRGSIVISNKLPDDEIRQQMREAVKRVLANPTRSGD
ncbi:late competence development ComFB family protein [Desulfovibrio oxyclinae]|jgi:hypothetical protein|uniref:late competence development ComFB family protein n=1 Tax=Desulfovibrio oxyclinae TaxID=63560 RepID=UPI0003734163|nr:late competence development ComFB family protein [Desulfovibrio oxyclinae]